MRILTGALLVLLWAGMAEAQETACPAGQAEASTPPMPGSEGTAPGNASTGWSGGLGGSHTGTNTQGAVPGSLSWQPPTARGLDLAGAPEPAAC